MIQIAIGVGLVIVAALAVFVMTRVAFSLRVVVPTNMVHIVQSARKTTSYGKDRPDGNVYWAWPAHLPFVGVTVTVLPESVFQINLDNYDAYDSGRLPFRVDVRAFFRIADSNMAAHRVPDFPDMEKQLQSIIQGAVRRVLSINALQHIMEARGELGAAFTAEVAPQLGEWGVTAVQPIEFMDIRDEQGSMVIQNIMAKDKSRIEKESRQAVAANLQAAQQAEIEAKQAVSMRQVEADQTVGQRQADQQKAVGIAQEVAKQEVLAQAKITAARNMEVKQVSDVQAADIARQVAEVQATQHKNVAITQSEGDREQARIASEGQLAAAKNLAEGVRAKGLAEGDAATALQMAPVNAQIKLATEIGANEGYQGYLVRVRQVEAYQAIGEAQAKALAVADIKVIANGGTVSSGISSIADIFTSAGGQAVGAALEGLSQTPAGKAVLKAVNGAAEA